MDVDMGGEMKSDVGEQASRDDQSTATGTLHQRSEWGVEPPMVATRREGYARREVVA